ncbi:hypothetical protein [Streptomyces lasiicapitis]|uniref:Transcriptional regulator n=1 Tax=Streptomyces lasiicapitis TaxID=1923961 RepID=A0ABQ2MKQ5_9ACTN|nr:hypothetical protein [Streptomyces lasiicapitis]GGO54040.1 hypothetical protein GCM10012286_62870 [Streptomyces lasiicapitis]
MAPGSPTAPVPNAAEVLRTRYTKRLPARLADLTGPTQGTVGLPLHVAWSGRRSFDMDRPRARMGLYRTVLAEGQREELETFLNRDLLIGQWPVLRTLISSVIRDVWEDAFAELAAARVSAA